MALALMRNAVAAVLARRCHALLVTDEPGPAVGAKLLVSKGDAGAIIGVKGAVIESLRQSTGAVIRVGPSEAVPDASEVSIRGVPDAVVVALTEVVGILRRSLVRGAAGAPTGGGAAGAEGPAVSAVVQLTVFGTQVKLDREAVGGIVGGGGAALAEVQRVMGAQVRSSARRYPDPATIARAPVLTLLPLATRCWPAGVGPDPPCPRGGRLHGARCPRPAAASPSGRAPHSGLRPCGARGARGRAREGGGDQRGPRGGSSFGGCLSR